MNPGYIVKRAAPGANPENALQFTTRDGICCGDATSAVACKYSITFDITSLTAVDVIRIGGVSYTLDSNYPMGYADGRNGLLENIRELVESLGYSSKDAITGSLSGNNFTISIDYSMLDFNWLDVATREFTPTACKVIGKKDAACCDARAAFQISGTDVIVTPTGCQTITNLIVNDGGGNIYNGDLSNGTGTDYTVSNGVITFDGSSATGQNWSGETTFTLTFTLAGCASTVTQVIQLTLVAS
jgi:hypothetical protein